MKRWTHLILIGIFACTALQARAQWKKVGQDMRGEAESERLGYSVSISNDGKIVAVGAPDNDSNGVLSGRVRVFRYSNGSWEQMGAGIDGAANYDNSGYSVALSGDGRRVAIGAPYNDRGTVDAGHVRVFEWQQGRWVQLGQDLVGEAIDEVAGWSVSISDDGNTVAVGTPGYGGDTGAVRIYTLENGMWRQKGSAITGVQSEQLGWSVSLSADGNTVAIGAPFNRDVDIGAGQVRVYHYQGGAWEQVGRPINGVDVGDRFGWSVSLSDDGNTVAVGAIWGSLNGPNAGQTTVFGLRNGEWQQLGQVIKGDVEYENSGASVSLNSDGSVVAVGAPRAKDDLSGYVRVYRWMGADWTLLEHEIPGEIEGEHSGYAVSLSADGNTVAVGAIYSVVDVVDRGRVRVYRRKSAATTAIEESTGVEVFTSATDAHVRLLFDRAYREISIQIIDVQGRVVYADKWYDTSELVLHPLTGEGLHFIRIRLDGKLLVLPLVRL